MHFSTVRINFLPSKIDFNRRSFTTVYHPFCDDTIMVILYCLDPAQILLFKYIPANLTFSLRKYYLSSPFSTLITLLNKCSIANSNIVFRTELSWKTIRCLHCLKTSLPFRLLVNSLNVLFWTEECRRRIVKFSQFYTAFKSHSTTLRGGNTKRESL